MITVRKRPCSSCPYRRDVPSGIWDASEYAKLPAYDRETFEQPTGLFHCHQLDGNLCDFQRSSWPRFQRFSWLHLGFWIYAGLVMRV